MPDLPPSRLRWLADWLIRRRVILLLAAVVITSLAVVPANRLDFDQSIESLYSPDDPHLRDYLESKTLFGGDEFILVVYTDPQLAESEGEDRLRAFSEKLSAVAGIESESTQNLADALSPASVPFLARPLINRHREDLRKLFEGMLVSDDGATTAIVLRALTEDKATVSRGETIRRIREIAAAHDPPARVIGEPVLIHDMFRYVEEDGALLFRVSLALLGLVLYVLFRSLRWVAAALGVVVVAIIWTKAILELSGLRLSMVSSILNSLVTVVGVAIVTHVMLHYRDERREHPRIESLRRTFVILAAPVFWDVVTTIAGFMALLSSNTTPVQSFGTMMALGSLMVFVASAFVLPGGILLGGLAADPGAAPAEDHLVGFLGSITGWVESHPRLLSGITLGMFGIVALGFRQLEVETDFSKNFRASSPVVQALSFVESRLGGSGTWEVNFPAPKELTPEFLNKVRNLAERLRSIGSDGVSSRVTKAVAITDLIDLMPGQVDEAEDVARKLELIRTIQPEFESSLYNAEAGRMRIVLRALERQPSATKLALIKTVEQHAAEEFPGAKTTGIFVLLTYIIESLLGDQVVNAVVAAASMTTIMTIAFRSFRIGLISLVPNFFPIFAVIGGMAWLGFKINIGTAMIASVSMGLTVDASIHYLAHYQRLRREGFSFSAALRETHRGVGLALVTSTVALIVGFTVLTLSHFIPLIYFGVLVSLAMFGGLIGNLLLLPLLLHWVERVRK